MQVVREPWHETLFDWYASEEVREVEEIRQMAGDIRRARMAAVAYHEPKKLDAFEKTLQSRIAAMSGAGPVDRAALKARAEKMAEDIARAERIARRKRQQPKES